MEALACGLPIVCFDIPGLSWFNGNVSLKAPAFDIDAYSQLLLEASSTNKLNSLRVNAKQVARKYSWDTVANRYESFFYQVLERENLND